jgi:hypothetical protein
MLKTATWPHRDLTIVRLDPIANARPAARGIGIDRWRGAVYNMLNQIYT